MGFRPYKNSATQGQINRVAIISDFERVDPDPDQLTLLKRKVDLFDQLEASDNPSWVDAVAAIENSYYQRMFQGGNFDRLRFRYHVYGFDNETLAAVFADLDTALPDPEEDP